MKNKKCPYHKECFDYDCDNCENCVFGEAIIKLHKRIDRLKKQNETLIIQRNAWALAAKVVKEDTVRTMQKRLHEKAYFETLGETGNYKMICKCVTVGNIDQIAEEILRITETKSNNERFKSNKDEKAD